MSLVDIKEKILAAEKKHNRAMGSTTLIAVSKVQPLERVEIALKDGHRIFGENRVQEAQSKWPYFKEQYDNIELHLIGPLQTNKTRAAMEIADSIHTVDRHKLANSLAMLAQELGKCPKLFVQVNTGDEEQKSGISPNEAENFVKECLSMDLPVEGLMCIPPITEEASLHFALLKKLLKIVVWHSSQWECLMILKKQLVLEQPMSESVRPSLVSV